MTASSEKIIHYYITEAGFVVWSKLCLSTQYYKPGTWSLCSLVMVHLQPFLGFLLQVAAKNQTKMTRGQTAGWAGVHGKRSAEATTAGHSFSEVCFFFFLRGLIHGF